MILRSVSTDRGNEDRNFDDESTEDKFPSFMRKKSLADSFRIK